MRLSLVESQRRRGSSRLIVLVALAAVTTGAFYFVGTGSDESGDEPAAPTKRAKRSAATKSKDTSSPKKEDGSPTKEDAKPAEVRVASIPDPKPSTTEQKRTPATEPERADAKGAPPVAIAEPDKSPVKIDAPVKVEITSETPASKVVLEPVAVTVPSLTPSAPAAIAAPAPQVVPPPVAAIPAKIARYAVLVFKKYDVDGSGNLESSEREKAPGLTREADRNADGVVSLDELTVFIAGYGRSRKLRLVAEAADAAPTQTADSKTPTTDSAQKSAAPRTDRRFFVTPKRVPQGLPDWFLEKDADGDLQLTPAEYSPTSLRAEIDDFTKLDLNSDGLLTADEYIRSAAAKPATPEKGAAGTPTTATPAK